MRGRAYYGFAADVEGRVHEHRTAGQPLELPDQVVVVRVRVARHGLDARRVVDVRDCRNVRADLVELVDAP